MTQPQCELFALLAPARLTAIADIGANRFQYDPPYKPMLERQLCTVVGCEPHAGALKDLHGSMAANEQFLSYAVGDGEEHTLNICRESGMSSLLKPNQHTMEHFPHFPDWAEIVGQERVRTVRLDDIKEISTIDLLKMDVQGSELAVLRNGRSKLAATVAIQTEVSFICLYESQPTIGEIDVEMRGQGFVPHSFASIDRRLIAPFRNPKDRFAGLNQLVEADMVYVRNFMLPQDMSDEQLKHLALIAHHVYRSCDLAANCLYHLHTRKAVPADALHRYVQMIAPSAMQATAS